MPASAMPVSSPSMAVSSRHVICRGSKPIASARLNAAIAADASLGSSNGLRTDWIWRFVMSQTISVQHSASKLCAGGRARR